MWATIALVAGLTLTQGQGSELKVSNERPLHSVLGPVRDNDKVLPGDIYYFGFDIDNIKLADDGKVRYSMAMEVISDKDGKSQYKQQPNPVESYNALGGQKVPIVSELFVGLDMAAGDYTMKLTIKDRTANKSHELTRKFQVLPKDFGIVRLNLSTSGNAASPPIGVVSQQMLVSYTIVSFQRDKGTKQPNISFELRVFDEDKKETLAKPFTGEVNNDIQESTLAIPAQFLLNLNRSGNFTVELKATDNLSKKTAKQTFALKVLEVGK